MTRTFLLFAFLLLTSGVGLAQAGHGGQKNSLRGLKGVRLVVMFARAEAVDEAERPEILKLVEADATAKFQKAGIPLLRYPEKPEDDLAQFMVYITCDKMNGFVNPLVVDVKLLQRVRLTRDPSIETGLATWQAGGIGGPTLTIEMTRSLVAMEIDQFIKDYTAVNATSARR